MASVGLVLTLLVGILHIGFLSLEMFLWTHPIGRKIFRTTPDFAQQSKALAANQGLYNGFLAAGLFVSVFHPDRSISMTLNIFCLSCVIVAGAYGAWTVSRRIFWIQSVPAILALIATWVANG